MCHDLHYLYAPDEQIQPNRPRNLCPKSKLRHCVDDLGEKGRAETFVVPATKKVARQMKEAKVKDRSVWQILEEAGRRIGVTGVFSQPKESFN